MRSSHFFHVVPRIPEQLHGLSDLARNLYWAWHPRAAELFRRISPEIWRDTNENPVKLLALVPQRRLEELARDEGFRHELEQVLEEFRRYLDASRWFPREVGGEWTVAYFSAEFGLARCLPIYSGGLGVLSGDHLKSSSDLGVPLVGVGLLYRHGYFRQYLASDGWQQESYEDVDIHQAPAELVLRGNRPLLVSVEYPDRPVFAQIWKVRVGTVALYLLDTHVPENTPGDQAIADYLYGGDLETRIRQELLLGVGGARALELLGIQPSVFHLNEGHSAFLILERIRQLMERRGLDFPTARAACARSNVFTTHTPVPAGFDLFPPDLLERYVTPLLERMQVPFDRIVAMGRTNPEDGSEPFNMALFAARNANFVNGVSQLHERVTKELFAALTPDTPVHEMPITSVTNGVHVASWCDPDLGDLLTRYLGEGWRHEPVEASVWERIHAIPDAELWRAHERARARLVAEARRLLRAQLLRRGAPRREVELAAEALDPEILTIGFARRFATYKRATLLLSQPERLMALLTHPTRPAQLVFAGKAHPRDVAGKKLIQTIAAFARQERVRHRVVFLENYDLGIARLLVSGCDLWLNTPRRPLEASGTSGMKALYNGVLNCSILDGWWAEAFDPEVGWAIGAGEDYDDEAYQDQVEAEALYHLLEQEIVPTFYERDASGLPRRWLQMMKASLAKLGPRFNTHRMVREYVQRLYKPAAADFGRLAAEDFAEARAEADWSERIREHWHEVAILEVRLDQEGSRVTIGSELRVEALVRLGGLQPSDVAVEAYVGPVDDHQNIQEGRGWRLEPVGHEGDVLRFRGLVPCRTSGFHGLRVRVRPDRAGVRTLFAPVCWEPLGAKIPR